MSSDAVACWEIAGGMAAAWMLALVFGCLPTKGYPIWLKRSEKPIVYWTVMAIFAGGTLAVACAALTA